MDCGEHNAPVSTDELPAGGWHGIRPRAAPGQRSPRDRRARSAAPARSPLRVRRGERICTALLVIDASPATGATCHASPRSSYRLSRTCRGAPGGGRQSMRGDRAGVATLQRRATANRTTLATPRRVRRPPTPLADLTSCRWRPSSGSAPRSPRSYVGSAKALKALAIASPA